MSNLSILEKLMRTRMFDEGFKNIKSWAKTKNINYDGRKREAGQRFAFMARHRYERDLKWAFEKYRNQIKYTSRRAHEKFNLVCARYATKGLRNAFLWWKKKDELVKLCDANYDTGPVRADFWEATREIDNLKAFMRKERYSENAIEMMCSKVNRDNEYLMKKYMIRMKLKTEKGQPYMPFVFDRWKKFVALRKLFAYKFRLVSNATNNVRADL